MDYLPHPVRILFISAAGYERSAQTKAAIEKNIQLSDPKLARQRSVMARWVQTAEVSGATDEQIADMKGRINVFEMIAEPVLYGDECSIFDVSALLPKLAKNDISAFSLRNLVLPGDETIYIHFGREEALIVNHDQDLYFEGAYVTQVYDEIDDDEVSTFRIALVLSDPEFGALAFDRPIGQTLKRNSDFVRFEVKPTNSVRQGFASLAQNGLAEESQVLTAPLKVYRAAYDLLVRSMIYLGQEGRDLELGYFDGAPERQLRKALNGDDDAASYLLENGFPAVQFVGRNIGPLLDLSEPDWGAESVGFTI
ncbi:hypothetical protein G6L63_23095 [Agrobacterium vitis]|uniref:Uncharacterized protein n=1 Tax=Agrobacterium vitis TaxID=373 RepID=A0A368NR47_AGRVI|nr:hypothetical protein [Agrobacterium vitis]KAA3516986.1 hypothetical protein DXM22_11065 [Agrobacterium vitis]KAA3529751.1 hypothetical protein DXT89_08590 [Agrobacterium vitis]MCF1477251.1 hypothetical protein [Agrobacterium vitis]MUZ97369.1 hypothetical protein [Agrobacterium vitis]MVA27982.1 hypothetical protein [Agrobacterium vitis]